MNVPTRLYGPAQPGTSTGVLYTVPANTTDIITSILIANTTGSAATVTLGMGGTTAAKQVVPAVSVAANTLFVMDLHLVLNAGETLDGLQGTGSAVTVTVSGVRRA